MNQKLRFEEENELRNRIKTEMNDGMNLREYSETI
jgi:hypothetical protein